VNLSFLTPPAALVGLVALAAVVVLVRAERRSRDLARGIGLVPRGRAAGAGGIVALVLVGLLVSLAAAQPVLSSVRDRDGRLDAEAIFVFDVTRSMLAREGRDGATRFDRARDVAKRLRSGIADTPAGAATITDRLLPLMFPSTSSNVFTATLDRPLGIEKPPPDRSGRGRATALGALAALATQNFFGAAADHRVAVVLTDGESLPTDLGTLRARLLGGHVVPIFVRFWDEDERVFDARGLPERGYRPDPDSGPQIEAVAEAGNGRVFEEGDLGGALAAIRRSLGDGPTGPRGRELQSRELAPFVLAAAFLPLGFLLWRRNLR
jgi:hypothetical protein